MGNYGAYEYFCSGSVYDCTIAMEIIVRHYNMSSLLLTSALRACLRCAAGGHFVSAGGSLRSPGVTLVNYKGDNISKYVCPTVLIDITRKITKFVNLKIFDA